MEAAAISGKPAVNPVSAIAVTGFFNGWDIDVPGIALRVVTKDKTINLKGCRYYSNFYKRQNSTLNPCNLKNTPALAAALLLISICTFAQDIVGKDNPAGTFSLGTRNSISMFNEDNAVGKGIGGQFRIQFGRRMNSEWYFDYITSKEEPYTYRNDYHIGWSAMFYEKNNYSFDRLLQPYLVVGHCFDYSKVIELNNKSNAVDRLSMAMQAGMGTHINITRKLDCSLTSQYMLHFGKDIETAVNGDEVIIEKQNHSHADGHLLFAVSFNYRFFKLWGNR